MASRFESLQATIPTMDRAARIEAFQQLWFDTGYFERQRVPAYRPCLEELIQHLVELSAPEVDEMVKATTGRIADQLPNSDHGEEVAWKDAPIIEKVAELFDRECDDPDRDITRCFTQLEFLISGGFIKAEHLPQIHSLLEIAPADGDHPLPCAGRWSLVRLIGDGSSVEFIREIWPRRKALGYPDDMPLDVLGQIGNEAAFDLTKQCLVPGGGAPLYSWARNPFMADADESTTTPSDLLQSFLDDEKLLDRFFPDLNPLLDGAQIDRGMWKIAWRCKEAGHLPTSSETLLAKHVDQACAQSTAEFGATPFGDGEFYDKLNSLSHTVGIACLFKHHPALEKWFSWALESPYPEIRQDALIGILKAGDPPPPDLAASIAGSAFCRPSLYSTLKWHGKLDLLPAEFLTDQMIAESAIATECDQSGVHFPPNRMRHLGGVEIDSGRYAVIAITTSEDWEPVDEDTREWTYIVGPMLPDPSLAADDLPDVEPSDGSHPGNSDSLESWVTGIVAPPKPEADSDQTSRNGLGPLDAIDPDALAHIINPPEGESEWIDFKLGDNISDDGEVVGFEIGARGMGETNTTILLSVRIEGANTSNETIGLEANSDTGLAKAESFMFAEPPCENSKFSYQFSVAYSRSKNDGVYVAIVRFPPLATLGQR